MDTVCTFKKLKKLRMAKETQTLITSKQIACTEQSNMLTWCQPSHLHTTRTTVSALSLNSWTAGHCVGVVVDY